MVINTNIEAQIAASNLQTSQARLGKSLARLSSGSKIIDPSDDAAGLAVAMRLDAQVQRLNAAKSNAEATPFRLPKLKTVISRKSAKPWTG